MKNKLVNIYMVGAVILMFFIEKYWVTSYVGKSFYKIMIFLIFPFIINKYVNIFKADYIKSYKKESIKEVIVLALSIFSLIILTYVALGRFFDFSSIAGNLEAKLSINRKNFIYIAIYISFINSFIEEFFFRGMGYLNNPQSHQSLISAILFALYHIIMVENWFSPILFVIVILSLFIAGLIFNFLAKRTNSILSSWLVHMLSNIAINIIAISLL